MTFYVLIAEDMRNVGGPMHMQDTPTIFRRYFRDPVAAKKCAERHYKKTYKSKRVIEWEALSKGFVSGDLGTVMYTIKCLKTED